MDENHVVIDLLNKLQSYTKATGGKINADLPQVVVIGAEGSGKSSVLDGLIGFRIFPRGAESGTKCPVVVQLMTVEDPRESGVEFDDFPDAGRIKDYHVARANIRWLMDRNEGRISDAPVILRLFSPDVISLTVVDLPGIKTLCPGREQTNFDDGVSSMCRKYMINENVIILAVIEANSDVGSSAGLSLVKEADPSGNRTIGVLTKLDQVGDDVIDAKSLLTGESSLVRLKLGINGVINSCQKDVDDSITIDKQLEKEKAFLDATYPDIAEYHGVPFLRTRLQEFLVQHILQKCFPQVQSKIRRILDENESRQKLDLHPSVMNPKDKYNLLGKVTSRFERDMKTELEGSAKSPEYSYLYGATKIKDIIELDLIASLAKVRKAANEKITDEMILTAFRNSRAFDSVFVYPEGVFRKIGQTQVEDMLEPSIKCADDVYSEILEISRRLLEDKQECGADSLDMKKALMAVTREELDANLKRAHDQIREYVCVQSSTIFSSNPQFLKRMGGLRHQLQRKFYLDNGDLVDEENEVEPKSCLFLFKNLFGKLPGKNRQPIVNTRAKAVQIALDGSKDTSNYCPYAKLRDPQVSQLIKDMLDLYFRFIQCQIQEYIPKLILVTLIKPFSSDVFGEMLRMKILERFEGLVGLTPNGKNKRAGDVTLANYKELEAIQSEIKQLLNYKREDDYESIQHNDATDIRVNFYDTYDENDDSSHPHSVNTMDSQVTNYI